jgi:hypothetical protein
MQPLRPLILLLALCAAAHGGTDRVTIYTPAFEGPQGLAQSVATILNLQLWETLRGADGRGQSFGLGVAVWGRPLETYSHQDAERRAKEISLLAQLVFWGKIYEYGDGAVAQGNLSIPLYHDFREHHPEEWDLEVAEGKADLHFAVDIPQRRYSFRPLVLTRKVIEHYSKPDAIEIWERRDGGALVGHIGNEFTRLGQIGDAAEVTSGGKRGWVHLPELSAHPSEAITFVAGIIRAFRGDWQGVSEMMVKVANEAAAPNELRTDAYLYLGLASEKLGNSGAAAFAKALELAPNARRCVEYSTLASLAEFQRHRSKSTPADRRDELARAKGLLTEKAALFPPADPWLDKVLTGIDQLNNGIN